MATTTGKPLVVGIVRCSNSLTNSLACAETGGVAVTASLVARKVYGKPMTATSVVVTATGTPRRVNKATTATVVVIGTLTKQVGKPLTVTVAATAAVVRRVTKLLTQTAAATATLVATFQARTGVVNPLTLTATAVVTTANFVRRTSKGVSATTVAVGATVTRRVAKTVSTASTGVDIPLQAGYVPDTVGSAPFAIGDRYKMLGAGQIVGARLFHTGNSPSTTHTMRLYDLAGTLLASSLPTVETTGAPYWVDAVFSAPISYVANDEFVIVFDETNYPQGALQATTAPTQATMVEGRYGTVGGFGNNSFGANLFADLVIRIGAPSTAVTATATITRRTGKLATASATGSAALTPTFVPPASGFTPDSLPGLNVWLDASQLALADGAAVSPWPDLSGGGHDGSIVGTPAPKVRANALNGKRVVRFNINEGRVRGVNGFVGALGPYNGTVVYVGRMVGPNVGRIYSGLYPEVNLLVGFYVNARDAMYDGGGGFVNNGIAWTGLVDLPTAWKMYGADASHDGTTYASRFFINGAGAGVNSSGTGAGFGGHYNLSGYDGTATNETCDCEVAELVIYNRKLSEVERAQVENYLYVKWLAPSTPQTATATVTATATITAAFQPAAPAGATQQDFSPIIVSV